MNKKKNLEDCIKKPERHSAWIYASNSRGILFEISKINNGRVPADFSGWTSGAKI